MKIKKMNNSLVEIDLPASKSISNRLLFALSLFSNDLKVKGLLNCEDTQVFLSNLEIMGAKFEKASDSLFLKQPLDLLSLPECALDLKDCGTALRFFTALCSLQDKEVTIRGSKRLLERPMQSLIDALVSLGASITWQKGEFLKVKGPITGNKLSVDASHSSQFVSALFFVVPFLSSPFYLHLEGKIVSKPYIHITQNILKQFGVEVIEEANQTFKISYAPEKPIGREYSVEKDCSSASYLLTAAHILGKGILIKDFNPFEMLQGDRVIVDILQKMGADYILHGKDLIFHGTSEIHPIVYDFINCPDIVLTVGVLAAFAKGKSTLKNVSNLEFKESNRLQALIEGLDKVGIETSREDDDLVIIGGRPKAALIKDYKDHRVVMAFSLLSLVNQEIKVEGGGYCQKSFPDFFSTLSLLNGAVQ
ncbi:3-phosphoshikimate 1-carboxyvinyltransferase [Chlamydiales bacterium SCGC AB-751-O23]|jgi:3-phosphoshikimate 1-carboxyvinyltransferase|nr:3-phosphoshikimate 1-carboxyvinyltransferase [Chlamydiales bacterium SCGC AB-751-O23]